MTKAGDHRKDGDARKDSDARKAWRAMGALVLDNERRREVSEKVGLSFGKTRALRRIARRPMSMKELAGLVGVEPPNLTAVVDELETLGLVERQAHPSDRRVKLVVATAAGARLAQQAEEILGRPPAGLYGLAGGELETLVALLEKVRGQEGSGLGPGQ